MITDFTRKHTYKLLESLAENLAEMLLCSLSGLEKITLKIEKPWAPVGLPLKTVSVEITRKWHTAYIAFGSNMGDKKMYIDNGIRGLAETKGCRIEAISDYLITEPYGVTDQDEFLNGVLKMRTLLTPEELLVRLHQLEQEANRERIIHWDRGHWIWISCSMIRKSLICQIFIFPILICTTEISFLYQ